MVRAADENLPPGFGFEWTELTYQEQLANSRPRVPVTVGIFGMCVLLVFLVHAAEYESWSLPTAIILIVPMCLLAAMAGVMLRGMDNNIFTQIGFVVLAGLSAEERRADRRVRQAAGEHHPGISPTQAALEASRLRLRPILMTSFAFILGVLPLVLADGAGYEMRQALGTTVFFGMIGVTFFGIFLTPVFYVVIRWVTTKLRPGAPAPGQRRGPDGHGTGGDGNGAHVVPAPVPALRIPAEQPQPAPATH
jgi:multidrug efflux pump subunit AcrB